MWPRSLTAAVKKMDMEQSAMSTSSSWSNTKDSWQAEAWEMYRTVGELSSVCRWMGSSAARVTLFAAVVDPETGRADNPSDNEEAQSIVAEMAGGSSGQSDMLRQAAVLLTVVGEFYVVIFVNEETDKETWKLVTPDRVKKSMSGGWEVNVDGDWREIDKDEDSIFRVWDRDPHFPEQATSSVRAALPVLREIRAMDKVIAAAAMSRVAGNGILMIPAEANIPDPDGPRGGDMDGVPPSSTMFRPAGSSANNLARVLSRTMKRSIDEPGSSSAVTPLVITAPKDTIDGFKHLKLDTDLTEQALQTREKAIRRLALSLDIPPEILTGLGDSTHWNASLVDESALRQHIAPMLATICEAMTVAVLLPFLTDPDADESGSPEDEIVIGFNMSALAQKQDKSDAALAAYDKGAISVQALRRELGFDEDDAPTAGSEQDRLRQLAEKLVTNAPSLLPYLSEVLGFGKLSGITPSVNSPTITEVPNVQRGA